MEQADGQARETTELRDRLSRLSEASLRINETLDLDTVLQEVIDSARSLAGASYGGISTIYESRRGKDLITSGMTTEEHQRLAETPGGAVFFQYLLGLAGPLRIPDMGSHFRLLGLPEFQPPMPATSFLATLLRNQGMAWGVIYLANGEGGREFTAEDEETLVMFASQAALVIANARRYREEQKARTDLETLINTSPVGVVVFDAKTGAAVSFNREAVRIMQVLRTPDSPPEQLLGVLTVQRGDGRRVSLAEVPVAQTMMAGETVRAEEILLSVPDGRSVSALMNATPIRSDDGEVETYVVTFQDMTALEELERLRAEFLGMVSHELRVPLTSITGSVTTLLEASSELDPAEMTQFFRIIRDQSNHMRYLIGDLLDVARIDTGTLPVSPAPADPAEMVDEAKNRFLSGGGRNNIQIDLPLDLPPVMADRRRIIQVVNNLLSNADRYSPEGSLIRVTAALQGLNVAISVADGGRGVSADVLPHLFRKFARIDGDDRGSSIAGSGLGLAICKGIVEAHGGRIWAESDGPGLGARFTFTIPAVEDAVHTTPVGPIRLPALSQRAARNHARILAVDDDPHALRYIRDALSKSGYEPIVTGDPDDVLHLIQEEEPDLVLLDLMLPGTDGIALMQGILEATDLPVIFVSIYGQEEVIARAFDMGATDYVVKPFSPTELGARIRAALRKRAAPGRAAPSDPYVLGDLTINYAERWVTLAGKPVQLTVSEYGVLYELSVNAGRVLSHDHLLQRVWGVRRSGEPGLVRTVMKRLRRKLGDDADNPTYLFTEPRVGYRMAKGEQPETTTQ